MTTDEACGLTDEQIEAAIETRRSEIAIAEMMLDLPMRERRTVYQFVQELLAMQRATAASGSSRLS